MISPNKNSILENIRKNLGRNPGYPIPSVPPPLPPRKINSIEAEIDTLIHEINLLSGEAIRMTPAGLFTSLSNLVETESIKKAMVWDTPCIKSLNIQDGLVKNGVEIVPIDSSKHKLAECDLGITEVDYALPDTGTLCLLSDKEKPRTVSLLPRVHLAIVKPENLRPDIHQVLEESKGTGYLVFITGPSRTADIELTVALGVHGPQKLYAWIIS